MAASSSSPPCGISKDESTLEQRASTCTGSTFNEAIQGRPSFNRVVLEGVGGEFCDDENFGMKHTAPSSKISSRSRFSSNLRAAIFASGEPSMIWAPCTVRTDHVYVSQPQPRAWAATATAGVTQLANDVMTSDMAGITPIAPISSPTLGVFGHSAGASQTAEVASATVGATQFAIGVMTADVAGTTPTTLFTSPPSGVLGHSEGASQPQPSAVAASATDGAPPLSVAKESPASVPGEDAAPITPRGPVEQRRGSDKGPQLVTGSCEVVPEASASSTESSAASGVARSSPNTTVPQPPCVPQAKRRPAPFGYRKA